MAVKLVMRGFDCELVKSTMAELLACLQELRFVFMVSAVEGQDLNESFLKRIAQLSVDELIRIFTDAPWDIAALLGPSVRITDAEGIVRLLQQRRSFPKRRYSRFAKPPLEAINSSTPVAEILHKLFHEPRASELFAEIVSTILAGLGDQELGSYFCVQPAWVMEVAHDYHRDLCGTAREEGFREEEEEIENAVVDLNVNDEEKGTDVE